MPAELLFQLPLLSEFIGHLAIKTIQKFSHEKQTLYLISYDSVQVLKCKKIIYTTFSSFNFFILIQVHTLSEIAYPFKASSPSGATKTVDGFSTPQSSMPSYLYIKWQQNTTRPDGICRRVIYEQYPHNSVWAPGYMEWR